MSRRPRTAIAILAALILVAMPGATTQAAISATLNPGDSLVSNYTPFHADVQTCSNHGGTGNVTDLTHLPIVYLATLHLGSLPQAAWVQCDVGTEFAISNTGSSAASTIGIKVTGAASWDGALQTYGLAGDIAHSYISLNLLDITPGSSDAPVTRYIDQAQIVACLGLTILGIPVAPCHYPDDGNAAADIYTTVQRGHTYRAYYEVYCAGNGDLGSDSCDYASTSLGYNITLGALSVHLGDDQFGSITKTDSDVLQQSTTIQSKIADAVTTIAGDITASTATILAKIQAVQTTLDTNVEQRQVHVEVQWRSTYQSHLVVSTTESGLPINTTVVSVKAGLPGQPFTNLTSQTVVTPLTTGVLNLAFPFTTTESVQIVVKDDGSSGVVHFGTALWTNQYG